MTGRRQGGGLRAATGLALAAAGALAVCALPASSATALDSGPLAGPAPAVRIAAGVSPGWVKVADPPVTGARAIATFGAAGVAVAGTGSKIALSTNGGATWTLRALPAGGSPVRSVVFSDAHHGWAVGPADTIDVTTNGGVTWKAVTQTGAFDAIAAATSVPLVCALTPSSIVTTTSVTSPNWAAEGTGLTPYPSAPVSAVAGAGGFAAAMGANGVLITRASGGAWTSQAGPFATSAVLALAPSPVWGNGAPDLFAIGANDVQGSDDEGNSFVSLGPPAGGSFTSGAFLGAPRSQLLVGGRSGLLERYVLTSGTWATDKGALTGTIVACAAGPGGVAYALSADGHVERTLSYGAAPFALGASAGTVTAGTAVRFTASSAVRAPGSLVLQARPAGGSWRGVRTWAWSANPATPGAVSLKPLSTTQYRLAFVLGGHTAAVSGTTGVAVRSRITVARTVFSLVRGDTYRVTGTVYPAQPGRKVTIWTDRGGTWHQVADGGVVALVRGSTFATRLFGTPLHETYHLQVRLAASSSRLAALSPGIKVTVR